MFELTGTVSVLFSVLLSATIGWQAAQGIFPFGLKGTGWDKGKKVRALSKESNLDLGASAAMNCMTIIWNIYIIISICYDLGRFRLTAILYITLVIIAFLLGWHHKALIEIIKRQRAEKKAAAKQAKANPHAASASKLLKDDDRTTDRTIAAGERNEFSDDSFFNADGSLNMNADDASDDIAFGSLSK